MTSALDPSLADYPPPAKRPRVADSYDPLNYYAPGPSIHPSNALPDQDGLGDAASKKNRKRPLSCGECRRSCDRVFPCQSCCKRGCAEICPDGALTGGKGSRFILANTEQLHEKIKSMSARIRELEDALRDVQGGHPLLREELLLIKKSADLFGVDPNQLQPPTAEGNGKHVDMYMGHAPASPQMLDDRSSLSPPARDPEDVSIPLDVLRVSDRFPAPSALTFDLNPGLRKRILELLPPQHEARYLCEQAAEHAAWHQNSDGSDGVPNMVHSIYNTSPATLNPHRLSYFLIILAIGVCVDQRRSHFSWAADAERYHQLSRAALCETSVINDPSMDAINALFYMARYLSMFSVDKEATEYAFAVLGIAMKLAVAVNRASSRSKVIPEELDKRKTLLWCMQNVDQRLSLMLRRAPSLSLRYVDVDPPTSSEFPASTHREIYQRWHYTFTEHCISPVLEAVVSPVSPPYSEILALDARVRDFEVPTFMQINPGTTSGNGLCIVQLWTHMTREVAFLNLHRQFFTQALNEGFWAHHKYAMSVVAVYQASVSLLFGLEAYYRQQPEYSVRSQRLWWNGLSSAVALSLIASRVPPSMMSSNALLELGKVVRFYSDVSDRCPLAARAQPVLEIIFDRARSHYLQSRYGLNHSDTYDPTTDPVCTFGVRAGGFVSAHSRTGNVMPSDSENALPPLTTHPKLRGVYEDATANSPPPNDPILMPGHLHRASVNGGTRNGGGANGRPSSPGVGVGGSAGFGVSAERSGLQHDGGPLSGYMGASAATAQHFKWLSSESNEYSWMTWF
ncbi:uncharacterized protein BXZ73DRAFT_51319 [Epithele typhae]|uniref:uncharacterized protein n=1 Tax=Epithele typhae TaxID=378194 RepID=UPI002007ECD4|nr:uncharacterized protein BXZ73DRAFT_51319 [Epithele typhae]KAH9922800.1 hypothetical protein BXZ73DRAFT_51319 [Epithele typhae]